MSGPLQLTPIQDALIAKLKASPTVVVVVQEEIRELDWVGESFTYPSVRADVQIATPISPDSCEEDRGNVILQLSAFSEGDSSREARQLADIVYVALAKKQLHSSSFSSGPLRFLSFGGPVREVGRTWRVDLFFVTNIYSR